MPNVPYNIILKGAEKLNQFLTKAKDNTNKLSKAAKETSGKITDGFNRAAQEGQKLKDKIKGIEAEIKKLEALQKRKSLGDKSRSDKINKSLKIQRGLLAKLNQQYATLGKTAIISTTASASGINKVGRSISLATRLMTSLRTTMITTFGVFGAIRFVTKSINTFVDFEKSMASVKAITGAVGKDFERLSNLAVDISSKGIFSATEVANLEIKLAKLGFTIQEISNMAGGIVDLATATGEDLGNAAELTASTIRGLGLASVDTQMVIDQLGKSFVSSGLDAGKYRESIKFIAPIAREMGIELDAIVATLGTLADRQIFGSIAGTGLRRIFIRMADSSSALSKAIGFTVKSSDDFIRAFRKLKEDGTTFADLLKLVDVRSLTATAALIGNTDALDGLLEKIRDANGAIKEMADIQLETLSGRANILANSWKALIIQLEQGNGVISRVGGFFIDLIGDIIETVKAYELLRETQARTPEERAIIRQQIKESRELRRLSKLTVDELKEEEKSRKNIVKQFEKAFELEKKKFGENADIGRIIEEQAANQRDDAAVLLELFNKIGLAEEDRLKITNLISERLNDQKDDIIEFSTEDFFSITTLKNDLKALKEQQVEVNLATDDGVLLYDALQKEIDKVSKKIEILTGKYKDNLKEIDLLNPSISKLTKELETAILLGDSDKIFDLTRQITSAKKFKDELNLLTKALINNEEQFAKTIDSIENTKIKKRDTASKKLKKYQKKQKEDAADELKILNERKAAFNKFAKDFAQAAKSIADSIVDSADRRVDAINNAINEAQSALQIELNLNKQGFASNVRAKQEELESLKELREKALEDQKKALAIQRTIESATQAINLATAISNIIKSLTGTLGFLGILASVGAGAALFGVFETLKKQAESVTKFEKGGWKELGGNRHSAGGVNLGDMGEAEKGEVVSVFNRSAVKKHKTLITNFTDMVNDGNVDFNMNHDIVGRVGRDAVVVNSSVSLDDSKQIDKMNGLLEKSLKQRQQYQLGKDKITITGNKTRIIRG